mgnify:CR=1 FL=1
MASFECKVLTPQGQTVTLNMKEKDKIVGVDVYIDP